MKYQKSMMKIMENILSSRDKRSIGDIIRSSRTGRNSSFRAIEWLKKNGFIMVENSGNQKMINNKMDNYLLQYKYYLDSIEFKTLDSFVKLIVKIFLSRVFEDNKIKMAVLFGSVLNKRSYNDLDIILLGDDLKQGHIKHYLNVREKIERAFDIIINVHFGEVSLDNLFKGIVVYQSSYINFQYKSEVKYLEFLEWLLEAIKNKNNKEIFEIAFKNAVVNLAFAFCFFHSLNPKTKEEAVDCLSFKIDSLNKLKERGIDIGEEIFK